METRILAPGADPERDPAIALGAALLREGGLVAFPTETVYGLGADATSASAIEAVFAAKERPADNPIIVHVADVAMLKEVVEGEDPRVALLAARFWPGPLTLVLPAREGVRPACRGLGTVGVRIPDHPVALALLRAAGIPIGAPSGNRSGRPSPTTALHVFDDLKGRVPLILEGGPCRIGIESTVLDLSGPSPQILRPGHVTAAALTATLGVAVIPGDEEALRRSPGTRHAHYRPAAPVVILGSSVGETAVERLVARLRPPSGYIATSSGRNIAISPSLIVVHAEHGLAHGLYAHLRELDRQKVAFILVEAPPEGEATWDRLRRAAKCTVSSDEEADALEVVAARD